MTILDYLRLHQTILDYIRLSQTIILNYLGNFLKTNFQLSQVILDNSLRLFYTTILKHLVLNYFNNYPFYPRQSLSTIETTILDILLKQYWTTINYATCYNNNNPPKSHHVNIVNFISPEKIVDDSSPLQAQHNCPQAGNAIMCLNWRQNLT